MSIDTSVKPLLTPALQSAIDLLLPLLARHAEERGVRQLGINLSSYVDPEGWTAVVLTQIVDLPFEQALQYSFTVTDSLGAWEAGLPAEVADTIRRDIIFEVDGNE